MTSRSGARKRRHPRVGFFGLLGAGNIGNDGSLEVVLAYVRQRHPEAELSCLCSGPELVEARYGVKAESLLWYHSRNRDTTGVLAALLKAVGKVADTLKILSWTRRCDVVIVPGAGVLETTLPLRPWGFPYAMALLGVSGRLWGTRVALLNVGSNVIRQRTTRRLYRIAARSAHYRSFRDELSRDAWREMGLDTAKDDLYPDLAFALPIPSGRPSDVVGVGVMEFHGGNDDRRRGEEIRSSYVDAMKRFVRRLVDDGREIRLLTGDEIDDPVVEEIFADLREHRPGLAPNRVTAAKLPTLGDLITEIAALGAVVGTRYHNVLCSLKLAKPTISISYSQKMDSIMANMGLAEYCQSARAVDVDLLVRQLAELEAKPEEFWQRLRDRSAAKGKLLEKQYDVLDRTLFRESEEIR